MASNQCIIKLRFYRYRYRSIDLQYNEKKKNKVPMEIWLECNEHIFPSISWHKINELFLSFSVFSNRFGNVLISKWKRNIRWNGRWLCLCVGRFILIVNLLRLIWPIELLANICECLIRIWIWICGCIQCRECRVHLMVLKTSNFQNYFEVRFIIVKTLKYYYYWSRSSTSTEMKMKPFQLICSFEVTLRTFSNFAIEFRSMCQ